MVRSLVPRPPNICSRGGLGTRLHGTLEFRGGRPRLRRCAEFRSRMTSDSGSGNMARAKEKLPTSSTPVAATTIVSDLASLCAAGNCSCQDV